MTTHETDRCQAVHGNACQCTLPEGHYHKTTSPHDCGYVRFIDWADARTNAPRSEVRLR